VARHNIFDDQLTTNLPETAGNSRIATDRRSAKTLMEWAFWTPSEIGGNARDDSHVRRRESDSGRTIAAYA
jgi:hypothetical protein